MDNLQKFRSRLNKAFVGILIFLVFFLIQAFSACGKRKLVFFNLLVSIKVVPVKNDYLLHPKFE